MKNVDVATVAVKEEKNKGGEANNNNNNQNNDKLMPVLVQIHHRPVRKRSVGSMESIDNDEDNDYVVGNNQNTLELEVGENWLCLVARNNNNNNNHDNNTTNGNINDSSNNNNNNNTRVRSVLDETQDAELSTSSGSSLIVPYPSVSCGAAANTTDNSTDYYLVLDVDDSYFYSGRQQQQQQQGQIQMQKQMQKQMRLALKDMRLPRTATDATHNNGDDDDTSNNATAEDEVLFEICLARLSSSPPPYTTKDGTKNNATTTTDPWDGYTCLEPLPRRQLRILQPGDRLCTRGPRVVGVDANDDNDDNDIMNTQPPQHNDDDNDEEEDFSGVGLVLEYRLELRTPASSPADDDDDEVELAAATTASSVGIELAAKSSPTSSSSSAANANANNIEMLDTQMTVLGGDDNNDDDDNSNDETTRAFKTPPIQLKILDSPTSSMQGDDNGNGAADADADDALTQPLLLGQATMESGDSQSDETTTGNDDNDNKGGGSLSDEKENKDDDDKNDGEDAIIVPPVVAEVVELLVTQPTDDDNNFNGGGGDDSDSETTIGGDFEIVVETSKDDDDNNKDKDKNVDVKKINNAAKDETKTKENDAEAKDVTPNKSATTTTKNASSKDPKEKEEVDDVGGDDDDDDDDDATVGPLEKGVDDLEDETKEKMDTGEKKVVEVIDSQETVVEESPVAADDTKVKESETVEKTKDDDDDIKEDDDDATQGQATTGENKDDEAGAIKDKATRAEESKIEEKPIDDEGDDDATQGQATDMHKDDETGATKDKATDSKAHDVKSSDKEEDSPVRPSPKRKHNKTYASHRSTRGEKKDETEEDTKSSTPPSPQQDEDQSENKDPPSSTEKPAAAGRKSKRTKPVETGVDNEKDDPKDETVVEDDGAVEKPDKDLEVNGVPDDSANKDEDDNDGEVEAPTTPSKVTEIVVGAESPQRWRKGASILAGLKDKETSDLSSPMAVSKKEKGKGKKTKKAKAVRVGRGKKRMTEEDDFDEDVPEETLLKISSSPTNSVGSDPAAKGRKQRSKKKKTEVCATPPAESKKSPIETPPARSVRKRKAVSKTSDSLKEKRARARTPAKDEDKEAGEGEDDREEDGSGVRIVATGVLLTKAQSNIIKRIGGTEIEELSEAHLATHIISGELRRTPKLMVGICTTENIVSLDWLIESGKAKQPLPTASFLLLNEKEAEKKYDFEMRTSLDRAEAMRKQGQKVLTGWSVHVCKGVAGKKAPPEQELKIIVEQAGGAWTPTLSQKALADVDVSRMLVITSDPEIKKQTSIKAVQNVLGDGAQKGTTSWLFGCIMKQKIEF